MKIITADISGSTPLFPDGEVIAFEGTHNSVALKIILPERLLAQEITSYRILFKNGYGEVGCSERLYAEDGELNCVLWSRLLTSDRLSFQVEAYAMENDVITLVDKGPVITFGLGKSIDPGCAFDGNAAGIALEFSEIEESINELFSQIAELKSSAGTGDDSAGSDSTDSAEIPDFPITVLTDPELDDITDDGIYLVKGQYSYTESDETATDVAEFPCFLYVLNSNDKVYQNMTLGMGIVSRTRNIGGEWKTQKIYFKGTTEPVMPLYIPPMGDEGDMLELSLSSNCKYKAVIEFDISINLPAVTPIAEGIYPEASILVCADFAEDVSVDWGNDVLFYNGVVPDITAGYYDLVFTFDPNAGKWCVGVLGKGAAE